MQFRHVGKRIQCIRSIYNKDTKKCEQKQICSIPDTTTTISEPLGVLADLTNQELKDLAAFLQNRNANTRSEKLRQLYENTPALLTDLNEIIKNNPDWISQEWINLIWEHIALIQKSLKKSGFAKPQKNQKNNSTEKKAQKSKRNQTNSTIQAAKKAQALKTPKNKPNNVTEKKQGAQPSNEPVSPTNFNPKKSIFADYHDEIISLLNDNKTINQIIEHLQVSYPIKADLFTYNGVRSYIRRNMKNS